MPEEWEKIRPSWKRIKKTNYFSKPQVTFSRSKEREKKSSYDRIGLNYAALKYIGITKSHKCFLLIRKNSRQAAIKILEDTRTTINDTFTLSINKKSASIRRACLFDFLDIPPKISASLIKTPFRTDLKAEDDLYIFDLPDKVIIPEDSEIEIDDTKLVNLLNDL